MAYRTVAPLLATALAVGCGGMSSSEGTKCGEGTVWVDGECVPDGASGGSGAASSGGWRATGSGGTPDDATAGSAGEPSCVTGDERCPCYPNGTCNNDLMCASNLCVRLPGTGGAGGSTVAEVGGSGGSEAGGTAGTTVAEIGGGGGAGAGGLVVGGGGRAGTAGLAGATATEIGGGGGTVAGGHAGAGGVGTEASCDNVQPCGGDVVGTWIVAGACVAVGGEIDLTGVGLGCSSGTVTGSTLHVSGAWTASVDGTYTDELAWSGEEEFTLSAGCLQVSGTTTTCDRVGGVLTGVGYMEGLYYDAVTCLADATPGGCNCTAIIDHPASAATGTYTVAGNVITTSRGAEYAYCVEGNTLTLTPTKFAQDTSTTNTGTIVLSK